MIIEHKARGSTITCLAITSANLMAYYHFYSFNSQNDSIAAFQENANIESFYSVSKYQDFKGSDTCIVTCKEKYNGKCNSFGCILNMMKHYQLHVGHQ